MLCEFLPVYFVNRFFLQNIEGYYRFSKINVNYGGVIYKEIYYIIKMKP